MKNPGDEARGKIHGLIHQMRAKRLVALMKKPHQDEAPKAEEDPADMGKLKAMFEPEEPAADDEEKKGKKKPF